jgi:hypothetical protein
MNYSGFDNRALFYLTSVFKANIEKPKLFPDMVLCPTYQLQ